MLDAVTTLDPRTVFSARLAFGRFVTGSIQTPQDITALGLPPSLAGQLEAKNKYPQFKFENYIQTSTDDADLIANDTYTAQASLLKILGQAFDEGRRRVPHHPFREYAARERQRNLQFHAQHHQPERRTSRIRIPVTPSRRSCWAP